MAALVKKIQQAGIEIWAVSSTNRWVIVEGLRDFGIPKERILAAEVRVKDGMITSEIVDVPTDEAKAAALKRVGLPAPDAVFGNSIHDLAMLEMARCPFPVNPSPALMEAAAKNGWGCFMPRAAEGVEVGGGRGIRLRLPARRSPAAGFGTEGFDRGRKFFIPLAVFCHLHWIGDRRAPTTP